MKDKKYVMCFDTRTGFLLFHGEYQSNEEMQWEIDRATVLNYGNKNCYLILSERAYKNLMLAYKKSHEFVKLYNKLYETKTDIDETLKQFKEVDKQDEL